MGNALVALALEFDLPFALQVEDGFGPLRSDDYQDFQFVARGVPITLRFTRKVRTERTALIDIHRPQDSASYSRAQVWFEGPPLEAQAGWTGHRAHARELIELALSVVNRYVMLYRELAGSHWLRALVMADVPEFAFVGFFEGGEKDSYFLEEAGRDTATLLDPATEQTLRDRFASGYEPDPIQSLAFTVRDLFERGEYWQAAAAIDLLFEARVMAQLRLAFERRGESAERIGQRFLDQEGEPLSAVAALHRYLPDLCGVDPHDPTGPLMQGLHQWEASSLGQRVASTDVSTNIGAHQAEDAIVAGWALLQELESRLHSGGEQLGEGEPSD